MHSAAAWWVALAALLPAATRGEGAEFELTVIQYQHPVAEKQEAFLARVADAISVAKKHGSGNVLVLNTGGTVSARSRLPAFPGVRPHATAFSVRDLEGGLPSLMKRVVGSPETFVAANLRSVLLARFAPKSAVFNIGGKMVGVVGYVSSDINTNAMASSGVVSIVPEVPAVRTEVRRLKNSGVHIVIAMGNAGHSQNAELARSVPDLDAVVSGPIEMRTIVTDTFPQAVRQPWNTVVPLLEVPVADEHLVGVTRLTFDGRHRLTSAAGMFTVADGSAPGDMEQKEIDLLQPDAVEGSGSSEEIGLLLDHSVVAIQQVVKQAVADVDQPSASADESSTGFDDEDEVFPVKATTQPADAAPPPSGPPAEAAAAQVEPLVLIQWPITAAQVEALKSAHRPITFEEVQALKKKFAAHTHGSADKQQAGHTGSTELSTTTAMEEGVTAAVVDKESSVSPVDEQATAAVVGMAEAAPAKEEASAPSMQDVIADYKETVPDVVTEKEAVAASVGEGTTINALKQPDYVSLEDENDLSMEKEANAALSENTANTVHVNGDSSAPPEEEKDGVIPVLQGTSSAPMEEGSSAALLVQTSADDVEKMGNVTPMEVEASVVVSEGSADVLPVKEEASPVPVEQKIEAAPVKGENSVNSSEWVASLANTGLVKVETDAASLGEESSSAPMEDEDSSVPVEKENISASVNDEHSSGPVKEETDVASLGEPEASAIHIQEEVNVSLSEASLTGAEEGVSSVNVEEKSNPPVAEHNIVTTSVEEQTSASSEEGGPSVVSVQAGESITLLEEGTDAGSEGDKADQMGSVTGGNTEIEENGQNMSKPEVVTGSINDVDKYQQATHIQTESDVQQDIKAAHGTISGIESGIDNSIKNEEALGINNAAEHGESDKKGSIIVITSGAIAEDTSPGVTGGEESIATSPDEDNSPSEGPASSLPDTVLTEISPIISMLTQPGTPTLKPSAENSEAEPDSSEPGAQENTESLPDKSGLSPDESQFPLEVTVETAGVAGIADKVVEELAKDGEVVPKVTEEAAAAGDRVIGITTTRISGDRDECSAVECDMGKIIADAITWKMAGSIDGAFVGNDIFEGYWQGEIRESDVYSVLKKNPMISLGVVRGDGLEELVNDLNDSPAFFHISGLHLSVDRTSHVAISLVCKTCRPVSEHPINPDASYVLAFAIDDHHLADFFESVRPSGLSLRDDVLIPYIRGVGVLRPPQDQRVTISFPLDTIGGHVWPALGSSAPSYPPLAQSEIYPGGSVEESADSWLPEVESADSWLPEVESVHLKRPASLQPAEVRPLSPPNEPAAQRPLTGRPTEVITQQNTAQPAQQAAQQIAHHQGANKIGQQQSALQQTAQQTAQQAALKAAQIAAQLIAQQQAAQQAAQQIAQQQAAQKAAQQAAQEPAQQVAQQIAVQQLPGQPQAVPQLALAQQLAATANKQTVLSALPQASPGQLAAGQVTAIRVDPQQLAAGQVVTLQQLTAGQVVTLQQLAAGQVNAIRVTPQQLAAGQVATSQQLSAGQVVTLQQLAAGQVNAIRVTPQQLGQISGQQQQQQRPAAVVITTTHGGNTWPTFWRLPVFSHFSKLTPLIGLPIALLAASVAAGALV